MSLRQILCPWCGTEMDIQHRHGTEIDLCPNCRGVWLDRGELDQLLERSGRYTAVPGKQQSAPRTGRRRGDPFPNEFEWF